MLDLVFNYTTREGFELKELSSVVLSDKVTKHRLADGVYDFFLLIKKDQTSSCGNFRSFITVKKLIIDKDEALNVLKQMSVKHGGEWKEYSNWGKLLFTLRKYNIKTLDKFEEYTFDFTKEQILKDGKVQYTKKEIKQIIEDNKY